MKYKITFIIIIVLFLLCFYLYYENTKLDTTELKIKNDKIPKNFNNFKIAHISDFHNEKSKNLTNKIVASLKKEKPNIIVITGDLIDSRRTNVEVAVNFIKQISPLAPIYYIPGNHESRCVKREEKNKSYEYLKELLLENSVEILDNRVKEIKIDNEVINLIGINDPGFKTSIRTNLSKIKYNKENYTILLSHRPEYFDTYIDNNIDLTLTGHAHGGQIRLPFIGGLYAPNQGVLPKYTSGIYEKDNKAMIVSRGIGNSLFPFRINNHPELVIITLEH